MTVSDSEKSVNLGEPLEPVDIKSAADNLTVLYSRGVFHLEIFKINQDGTVELQRNEQILGLGMGIDPEEGPVILVQEDANEGKRILLPIEQKQLFMRQDMTNNDTVTTFLCTPKDKPASIWRIGPKVVRGN